METVVLFLREKVDGHIDITLDMEELGEIPHTPIPDVKPKENAFPKAVRPKTFGRATYAEIKAYVQKQHGINVSSLNIAHVKEK